MQENFFILISLIFILGCKNTKTETTDSEYENSQNKDEFVEFTYRDNEGVMKIFIKSESQSFERTFMNPTPIIPDTIKFKDKGTNEIVELKISNSDASIFKAENPATNEKLEFLNEFSAIITMFRDNKKYIFYKEYTCYSQQGEMLTTSGYPTFIPFFYAPNILETPKQIKVLELNSQNHPKYPNASYFKGVLPNGKKVDIIGHYYQDNNPKTQITLIIEGKETVFIEI